VKKQAIAAAFMLILLFSAVTLFQFVSLAKANTVQLQTVQSSEPKPQFEFDVVRAYLQGNSCSLTYNITYVSELPSSNKTIIEVYSIELFSNGDLLSSYGQGFLVDGNIELDKLFGLTSYIPYASSGIRSVNWNGSELRPLSLQLLHALNPYEDFPISLRVKRLGLITVEGESVDNELSSGNIIEQVELERHGEGFLYSALPVSSPTPSPSPEPTPKVEPFPTTLVVASVVLVAVIGIGLLVYFKKRKS
jgi:hypothetical protein